jgi:hypothetical protein
LLILFCGFALGAWGTAQSAAERHANGYADSQPDGDMACRHAEGYA